MAVKDNKIDGKKVAKNEKPVKIKGDFLEVFKVVKKNKEQNSKKNKKD